MKREMMLKKLNEITAITANLTGTYDMGIQFDVMTSRGICTNFGNVGNWPCYKMPITEDLIKLRNLLKSGIDVNNEEILKVRVCENLLTYSDMLQGYKTVISGAPLNNCCKNLKLALLDLNVENESFYAYVDLEPWGKNTVKIFETYKELNMYFASVFGGDEELYDEMDDDDLENAYQAAKENGWDGVIFNDYTKVYVAN